MCHDFAIVLPTHLISHFCQISKDFQTAYSSLHIRISVKSQQKINYISKFKLAHRQTKNYANYCFVLRFTFDQTGLIFFGGEGHPVSHKVYTAFSREINEPAFEGKSPDLMLTVVCCSFYLKWSYSA